MRIGVDLGGTKIEAIAIDEVGRERLRRRVETPRGEYEAIVAAVVELVGAVQREVGSSTVGIGTPGAISPATGLLRNSNTVCLNGKPLDRDLEAALGQPIRIANDANCFALSEATDGAGAGASVVFGVIIGTGTGAGVVVDGRVLQGPNAIAGEWGHSPLPWPEDGERPGPPCYCGLHGCIETFLCGQGLARAHGGSIGAEAIAEAARGGDGRALAALERYADRIARALASVINLLDPDVIVLGGGLSNIERLYERVPLLWGDYVFSDQVATRLVRAQHGDSSGVRGAAWLWAEN